MSDFKRDVYKALDIAIQNHYAMLCRTVDRATFRIHLGYKFPSLSNHSLDSYASQLRGGYRRITPSLADALDELLHTNYEDIQVRCFCQVYEEMREVMDLMKYAEH